MTCDNLRDPVQQHRSPGHHLKSLRPICPFYPLYLIYLYPRRSYFHYLSANWQYYINVKMSLLKTTSKIGQLFSKLACPIGTVLDTLDVMIFPSYLLNRYSSDYSLMYVFYYYWIYIVFILLIVVKLFSKLTYLSIVCVLLLLIVHSYNFSIFFK